MNEISYVPILKTSDAEIRAIENLAEGAKDKITPLFELTRSRICKKVPEGDIFRRLNRLIDAYGERRFILDLTSDPAMTNEQIERLRDNRHGYRNWVRFLLSLKSDLPDIVPVVQISDVGVGTSDEFYDAIRRQVNSLDEHFDSIVYRFPLEYEYLDQDLAIITQAASENKMVYMLDAGFIPAEKGQIYGEHASTVIETISNFPSGAIVLCGTSFPRNATDLGGDEQGEFGLEECVFYGCADRQTEHALIYGDYATVNPTRSLQAGGRGWVPRIDVPTEGTIFYYRSRRTEAEANYANAYTRVASRVSRSQKYARLRRSLPTCWGSEQIDLAARGQPQGLSPSFWISVRINIHITLRVALL